MDAVLYIIPNLGLKDAFQFILKNRYKIKKREIIRLLDKCIKEYGETVETLIVTYNILLIRLIVR